jgi:hypothetical protein
MAGLASRQRSDSFRLGGSRSEQRTPAEPGGFRVRAIWALGVAPHRAEAGLIALTLLPLPESVVALARDRLAHQRALLLLQLQKRRLTAVAQHLTAEANHALFD